MMNTLHKSVREEAAKWFLRLQHADLDHPDRSKFESWLMQSAAHQDAYRAIVQAWQDFDSHKQIEVLAEAMQRKKLDEDIKRRSKVASLAKFASIVVLGFCAVFAYQTWQDWQQQPLTHIAQSSQVGHIVSQYLSDGTQLTLDARSDVEVIYYRHKRVVKLKQGQAVFDVVKDQSRPFVVESANARITVKGTRFLVNRLKEKTYVAVDHGKVQVEALTSDGKPSTSIIVLTNGQVAEITTAQSLHKLDRNALSMFEFTQGRIIFEDADLNEVAETVSRYRAIPLVSHVNQSVGITAVVKIKEMEAFIQSLPQVADVTVKHSASKTEINRSTNRNQ
ncbi:FecR family protein [Methylotenera sp. N17]|uniref:FecR family protein n=1 Tax=Methylotenera sp. N17 TaxID=1502761 RepID=UPI00064854AC|nr:FecR domain-containing protein [Methylotenera sp. N17]